MTSSILIRQRYFAGLSRNVFLLALSSLFGDISTEMLYPVLPTFLTRTLGASGSVVGLVDGFAQAAQNIAQAFAGTLSDRLRKRKSLALVGYFLAAVAKPLIGLSTSWHGVFGARLLDRIGAGSRSAVRDALIASSVDDRNRGRAFGLEGLGDNAGACIGPLLAVVLLYEVHLGLRPIFYWALVPGLMALLMVVFVREPQAQDVTRSNIDVSLRRLPRPYWSYLLAIAVFSVGNSSNAFLILRTQDAGVPLAATIVIYAAFNLVAAVVSYPAGLLSDKWGRRQVLVACFGIFLITYLGFALTLSAPWIATFFILYGLYQGTFRAVGKALAVDLAPEWLRASGVGGYSATVGIFQLVASLAAGVLWDRMGHAAVFYYGAISALAGIVGLLLLVPQDVARGARGSS